MVRLWALGLLRARSGRLLGAVAGVALAVALLAALGAFLRTSTASMTERAVTAVPVDWQVELLAGADRSAIEDAARKAAPVRQAEWVGYADVQGFKASTGGTAQTTGPGKVLGLAPSYVATFPAQLRLLLGSLDGVLVAQQTAANLHVGLGDTVTIHRFAQPDATLTVVGVVDLPKSDSLFQAVGVPPGAAPQAPPDNVLFLPAALWHEVFDPQAAARPDTVHDQLHLGLMHSGLPPDPVAAYVEAGSQGRNFEARAVGKALLADNLAARLGAVREDALYARILFLFLGAPGVIMAVLLTLIVAAGGTGRRRRDEALLRVRGASAGQILRLSATEAVMVGVSGAVAGGILAEVSSRAAVFDTGVLTRAGLPWLAGALILGLGLSVAAILVPAWRRARHSTVVAAGRTHEPPQSMWARAYLDIVLLVLAAVVFWRSAAAGYQVVLAPEGVAATSGDYAAFLSPLLLWTGLGLLTVRLAREGLSRGRAAVAAMLAPLAGALASIVVREFPTAPKDSFLVANASYVAEKTGSPPSEVVLMRVAGDPARVVAAVTRAAAGLPGAKVSDIGQAQRMIGSSLTAVDLAGLTRLELAFALVMVAAAAGLVLGLGLADRQRSFAILAALGAKPRQLGAFVWSEAALVFVGGSIVGIAAGGAVAYVLVKLLTGVFDPPPEALSVPWLYLTALVVAAGLAVALAAVGATRSARIDVVEKLRSEA